MSSALPSEDDCLDNLLEYWPDSDKLDMHSLLNAFAGDAGGAAAAAAGAGECERHDDSNTNNTMHETLCVTAA